MELEALKMWERESLPTTHGGETHHQSHSNNKKILKIKSC